MRDFISNTGGISPIKISDVDDNKAENSVVWNSAKIQKLLDDHEAGLIDIKTIKNSPFKDNDQSWKKANIVFELTPEEMTEMRRCKADVVYFAEHYCQIMTEKGVQTVELHDYQKEIVNAFKNNRFNILMASRQVGKTWMSSVFITWYTIFHYDKNSLVIADNGATTKEVVDKIKTIFENLPFWLKPGCITNAVMTLKFDNGCRVIGRSTTKKSGIGFNIHLLYVDEFAHINESYLDHFFRSIYPTISASSTSKIIITSTPNGQNKFYEIYRDALDGKSSFNPLRVDWWQFPGRDEEWKQFTIANLGSEEAFNQEYGLQFFSSDKLLLHSKDLKKIDKLKTKYVKPYYPDLGEEYQHFIEHFTVHPNFVNRTASDIKNDPNYYVFSIDTADGLGKDFLVLNIFKFVPLPIKMLKPIKNLIKDKTDIFGLVQIATYRTNEININEFCDVVDFFTYTLFNPERVRLNIELNHKGEFVLDKLYNNEQYWDGQVIHTKHTLLADKFKPGLRLGSGEMKNKVCERFKYATMVNKIVPNELKTIAELSSFGRTKGGSYRSQSGNDDLAITCVNLSAFFESPNFWELAEDVLETIEKSMDPKVRAYMKAVVETILTTDPNAESILQQKMKDLAVLGDLNRMEKVKDPRMVDRMFSEEAIENKRIIAEQFRTGRGPDIPKELTESEIDEFKKVFNHQRKMW